MVTRMGFSAEYIEKLSPIERELINTYYKKDLEEQKKREENNNGIPPGPNIGPVRAHDPAMNNI